MWLSPGLRLREFLFCFVCIHVCMHVACTCIHGTGDRTLEDTEREGIGKGGQEEGVWTLGPQRAGSRDKGEQVGIPTKK